MRERSRYSRHRERKPVVAVDPPAPVEVIEPVEDVRTLSPEALRTLSWKAAKSYAFDAFGIKARGWSELIEEYTAARG